MKAAAQAVIQRCSAKKVFLEISQNSQENTYARVSFLIKTFFIKKDPLAQVLFCKFCDIWKNTFPHRNLWWLFLSYEEIQYVKLNQMFFRHQEIRLM